MRLMIRIAGVMMAALALSACVSMSPNMPASNSSLRISQIQIDMGPYLANEGGGANIIKAELAKQANKQFARYKGSKTDPVLVLQIQTVMLSKGFGVTRGGRDGGTDAMQGAAIVKAGSKQIVYPITAEIEADDVVEPTDIVADFLGWTEKYVFGR